MNRTQKLVELSKLLEMANQNEDKMDGTTAPVKELINGHEIVFGIWTDPSKSPPDNLGFHIIKGRRAMMEMGSGDNSRDLTVTAILCESHEKAVATQQMFGEPDLD